MATNILFLVISILIFSPSPASAQPASSFTYSFVYKGLDEVVRPIDFDAGSVVLAQSDKLKIYLKHESAVYVYLFLHDTEDKLYQLYPQSFGAPPAALNNALSAFIPEGFQWFEFEEGGGTERFYLFASTERLRLLEDCVKAYARIAAARNRDEAAFREAREKALSEIKRIQVANFDFVKKAREDLVFAAGEFRGLEENFEFPARKVEFDAFYARTIRVSH